MAIFIRPTMLMQITFTYEQVTQRAESEIRAWMTRADQPDLLKSDRVRCRERANGALALWSALTILCRVSTAQLPARRRYIGRWESSRYPGS